MANIPFSNLSYPTVTIASGGTTSNAINLNDYMCDLKSPHRLFGIITPSALTGTSFGVQASVDGGTTYNTMYDASGTAIAIAAAASRYITLDPAIFAAVTNLKLVSNGTEAADRTITLVLRAV